KACMAERDFFRKIGWIGVIRPGFQQQHGSLRVCRQPTGQHTSSRSPADDHHVIFHECPSFTDIPRILASATAIVSPFRADGNKRTHDKYCWLPRSKRGSAVVIRTPLATPNRPIPAGQPLV